MNTKQHPKTQPITLAIKILFIQIAPPNTFVPNSVEIISRQTWNVGVCIISTQISLGAKFQSTGKCQLDILLFQLRTAVLSEIN